MALMPIIAETWYAGDQRADADRGFFGAIQQTEMRLAGRFELCRRGGFLLTGMLSGQQHVHGRHDKQGE